MGVNLGTMGGVLCCSKGRNEQNEVDEN